MSFPSPSVVPPTFTQTPSIYYQGITFGPSPFSLTGPSGQGLQGLVDMPPVRTGDAGAPRVHGSYIGLDLLDERAPTFAIDVGPPFGSYVDMAGAMAALRTALAPTGDVEHPLFFQINSDSPMLVSMVRPRKRTTNVDIPYTLGNIAMGVALQFAATDPVVYAAGTLDPSVGVPTPLGGLTFNLAFNFGFGGGTEFGLITATNYGDMPCYPIITFTGPMTYPTLTNASLVGNPYIQFGISLLTGDTLVVNTDPKYRSAVYTASGTTQGVSRLFTLAQGSQWWAIPPSSASSLQFTTLDSSPVVGTCAVEYTSAYSAAN